MEKLESLLAALKTANPEFHRDPGRLAVFVTKGRMVHRRSPALGFEYRYRCEIFVEDFGRSIDAIMVPLLVWLRTNQPDIFLNFTAEDSAVQFSADILDNDRVDILIAFELTEAVTVAANGDGRWVVAHLPEPDPDDPLVDGARIDVPLHQLWLGDAPLIGE